jgi:competence protein ComEC
MTSTEAPKRGYPTRYRPLLWVAIAVAAGIVVDRYCGTAVGLPLWWTVAAILAAASYCLLRFSPGQCSALLLLASIAALGGVWHNFQWNYLDADHLARYAGETSAPVCVEVVAADRLLWTPAPPANPLSVVPAGSRSELMVDVARVRDGTRWLPATGRCRLRVEGELSGVRRGNRLRVFAQYGRPLAALNPGQYDWALAERGSGRYVELFSRVPQCVSAIESRDSDFSGRWLDAASYWCQHQLSKYVGPENRDLALALVLGARERLDDSQFEPFLQTGTVHLLVVSGLHVGFLAAWVWLLVRAGLVTQRTGILATAVLVVAYAAIVGGRPPVVRATVLVLLGLWMLTIGRRPTSANLLAAAALVVLIYNPSELFRGGTQLSFLCVAVISWYAKMTFEGRQLDPLTRLIREAEPWPRRSLRWSATWLGRMFTVSLVIWLATVPLVSYHFHLAAPVSVLITPLVWPLVAIALVTGFAICTVAWVLPPLAQVLGWISSLALGATRRLVDYADSFSWGHFYTPGPAAWWLLGLYAMLAVFALWSARLSWRWQVATLALWMAAGFAAAGVGRHHERLDCTFLAMGHGTCVVLELPGGQTMLYDAGSLGSPEGATQTVASFLWSRGITHIDAVVLSHADLDHYNAMPGLVERFPIGAVYVSPLMFDPWATQGQLTGPNYLKETLEAAGVPLREVWMNDRLHAADSAVQIDVLHPPRTGVVGSDNANSILLRLSYAGHSILLPGDLESPGIEAVMADPPVDCDILLAPHHGSANSDPPGFASWCTPEWVVVSGGRNVRQVSVTVQSYRDVGAQVICTADLGATGFSLTPEWLRVSTFHSGVLNE